MATTFLFRFTPSMMERDALEAIFVQREAIAQRTIELIRTSALTPSKHHTLMIGPRGIGKTHIISLIFHRVKAMEDLRESLFIAWLREEEWGITSLLDLLVRIFRALAAEYKDTELEGRVEALYGLTPDEMERALGKLLKEYVGNRALLVLIENLDDIFQGLGDEGQKRLRAYIQENPFLTIVATSQSLFNGVSLQSSPFYGFFRIQHLQGLSFEEAVELLVNIARYRRDEDLASFIQTPMGRARIRAVHHLAGGNHRVYVIFSQFITRESLDNLVEPFMRMLDDLTPYYQERMRWLSPQQRKIVAFLSNNRRPATVKEIAQRCFMTHQTASSQLKSLRDLEYVQSDAIGRESYYELREPLMRLCVEVKKNRGEPVGLFIDFLRLWYLPDELKLRLNELRPDAAIEREYLLHTLKAIEEDPSDPRVKACLKDYQTCIESGDFSQALEITRELITIRGDAIDWLAQSSCLFSAGKHEEALQSCNKALELTPGFHIALVWKTLILNRMGRSEDASVLLDNDFGDISEIKIPKFWFAYGCALYSSERNDKAIESFDRAIELGMNDAEIWSFRGSALTDMELYEEALDSYTKANELRADKPETWLSQGHVLIDLKRYQEAVACFDKAINLASSSVAAWFERGKALALLNNYQEALKSLDHVIENEDSHLNAWLIRGILLSLLSRFDEALAAYDKAIELGLTYELLFIARAQMLIELGRWDEGISALDESFQRIIQAGDSIDIDTEVIIRHLLLSAQEGETLKERLTTLLTYSTSTELYHR